MAVGAGAYLQLVDNPIDPGNAVLGNLIVNGYANIAGDVNLQSTVRSHRECDDSRYRVSWQYHIESRVS